MVNPEETSVLRASRRTVLLASAGLAAVTAARTAVASAAPAPAAPIDLNPGDAAASIQQAIDQTAADGGGTVELPAGTFEISASLRMRSGVSLQGAGREATVLKEHADLGAKPIIQVQGTPREPVVEVTLSALTVRNGAATTEGWSSGQDGIVVDWAETISLHDICVTEIAGRYGVRFYATGGITVRDCAFLRCTHTMLQLMPDTRDIVVADCVFDTVTSTRYSYSYTLATGHDGNLNQFGTHWPTNLLVENNEFRNNPRWEGIDCHGAVNVTIRNNHVENCRVGIMVGMASPWHVSHPSTSNVVIEGNTVIQGEVDNAPAGRGIILAGGSEDRQDTYRTHNVSIRDNHVVGFGGASTSHGVITVYSSENVAIENNTLEDFGGHGISLLDTLYRVRVRGNVFHNQGRRYENGTETACVIGPRFAVYGLTVDNNVVRADSDGQRPDHFLHSGHQFQSWQIGWNDTEAVAGSVWSGVENLPVDKTDPQELRLFQQDGDLIRDLSGTPAWRVVTSDDACAASWDTGVVGTVTTAAGNRIVELHDPEDGETHPAWAALPPGMGIALDGDATRVLDNSAAPRFGVTLTLNDPAVRDAEAASIVHQQLTLDEIGPTTVGLDEIVAHLRQWGEGIDSYLDQLEAGIERVRDALDADNPTRAAAAVRPLRTTVTRASDGVSAGAKAALVARVDELESRLS